ncbi:MAG: TIR domain-containing protein [Parasphingorhabdus sp.]|nr:TIR domain-containing protein [Parasphingorhabdus sp.]
MELDQIAGKDSQPAGFAAFLSYSHADAGVAQRLHRKLESYRLPRKMRRNGQIRLGRIFRDREDLPAATDLSESVKAALRDSAALVVICSPNAKASPWVAKEITLFREIHPDRPILAALITGEPANAFPEPLSDGAEPLAADLRKAGDGWRLGFLKIVAGIAGVRLDALIQRDAQRRIRRVMAVTSIALIAVLLMAAMTTLAVQARREADRQRAEAEGLIEYMLTDLRARLKTVGRLDVMTDVNDRAMDYYRDQGGLAALPADSLDRRSRILHAMGEDDAERGELTLANSRFQAASRVTENLLDREPANAARIFAHAQSEYWIGYIAYRRGDRAAAAPHFRAYRALAERLVSSDSANPKWRRELAYANGNLCSLALLKPGDPVAARKDCQTAVSQWENLRRSLPDDKEVAGSLANSHAWLGQTYDDGGELENALREYRIQVQILEQLQAKYPNDMLVADQVMRGWMTMAELLVRLKKPEEARQFAGQAQDLANILVNRDPQNAEWKKWQRRITRLMK